MKGLLTKKIDKLTLLAEALLVRETLVKAELERLIGKRFAKTTKDIHAEDQLPLNEAQPADMQKMIPLPNDLEQV